MVLGRASLDLVKKAKKKLLKKKIPFWSRVEKENLLLKAILTVLASIAHNPTTITAPSSIIRHLMNKRLIKRGAVPHTFLLTNKGKKVYHLLISSGIKSPKLRFH